MATKKATKKKATIKKSAPKFKFVAVSQDGEFFACTEAPIFANGYPCWPCPDGHYASYGTNCCGKRSKETTPIGTIKSVATLETHLALVDRDGINGPYRIDYQEYKQILNHESGADKSGRLLKPTDLYQTAF
jgi:hypothetical protein